MRNKIKQVYRSKKDFQDFHYQLKQIPCPHCNAIGGLILHGYLYGYGVKVYSERIIRGHRIFCSNRNRRPGCGKTFSVMASHILKGFLITANDLWKFLKNAAQGILKAHIFESLNLSFSKTTAYRLWKVFSNTQSRLRTLLLTLCPCPETVSDSDPTTETIHHLKAAFKDNNHVISSFQYHFQTSVL